MDSFNAEETKTKLATYFLLVRCLDFSSALKMEAIYSLEMSTDHRVLSKNYDSS
jgi:hypothetical protein